MIEPKKTPIADVSGEEQSGVYVIGHGDRILYVGQSERLQNRIADHLAGAFLSHLSWGMRVLLDDPVKIAECWVVIIPQETCDLAYAEMGFDESAFRKATRGWAEAEVIANFGPELNSQHQDSNIAETIVSQSLRDALDRTVSKQ